MCILVNGDCDSNTGPSGSTECVLINNPPYNKKQWATCLTNAYIKEKSQGKYSCVYSSATYCWYQCMIEIYDVQQGPVYGSCVCDESASTSSTNAPLFTLPPECYSPDGTSCEWYKDCLEKKYQCESTEAAYALSYANKFCELYSTSYNKFSENGQTWIDAVRKCLQMKLVPLLRPFITTTCEEIRDTAFKSHTECYVYPKQGDLLLSYCFLNVFDWWRVFWIVKEAMIDVPYQSLTGYLETSYLCSDFHVYYENIPVRSVHLTINNLSKTKSAATNLNELATLIGGSMAHLLNWNLKRLDFFAYHLNASVISNSNQFIIALLIVDKDLMSNETNSTAIINQTMTDLIEAVKLGGIFKYVCTASLLDECSFEHEFFLRIAQSFPFMEELTVRNQKRQINKTFRKSKNLSIIKYRSIKR
ncbi:unnamed protein product [Rotaria sp. Silwood1]|nr:unnamed protein product [Rotaria sp. Silwood1]CAF1652113.1 unnamed protein product [Rotaria sp. Silwood1]CAF3589674.1 unnamed protein product [Rotaria sp. Silwood1]CAF3636259.1 unnamed protein product [Rotaria sp. Silwood1]CAF4853837.1 unnamed protein product [Rotaria sp. Silwood1]